MGTSVVKVRHRQPAKGADRPEPKGHAGWLVGCQHRRRWHKGPPDYRTQPPHPPLHIGKTGKPHPPIRLSTWDNRVSPIRPTVATRWYPDRKEGHDGGGRGTAEQAKAAL